MELEDELATGVVLLSTCNMSKDGEIVRRWMEMVLGDKFLSDLPSALYSGELLCDLINKLYKALGMKSQISPVRNVGRCEVDALNNVLEYRRACEVLGVARRDLFQPDDLLKRKNMEKVYSNILALQKVAVSLSNRRSIDERSSMINQADWSPMSEHSVFVDNNGDDGFDVDLRLESPNAVQMLQQSRWQRLLFEYEHQQERKEERDRVGDSSASDGMGPLAHGIWRTEERIRAILMRDDHEFGTVPDDLHGKLWMLASGAQLEMCKNKGQFERLLALQLKNTEATRQIDVDLHRTVADEDKALWNKEKSSMMRRVLVAYSFYNPNLGYCQGLNYIVARILHFLGEEEAFYLLVAIVRLVPDDYYTTMLGLAVDQHVFADLVRLQYPEVSEHLSELGGSGMELSLACTEWFLTLFASPCDREVTFQIWDAIFLQGDEVLFRVALALLQQAKAELVACNTYGDMLKQLNELGRGDIDAKELMKISRKQDCVIRGRVEDFRAHHRLQLASGIVASTVDADDARSSTTGRRSSEYRSEPRLRIFGRKKQGICRHIDKIPPRLARTFDRNITDEYVESIRQDHFNFTEYYEGMQLQIVEDYWGSADNSHEWVARNACRMPTDCFTVSNVQENDKSYRMNSDINLVSHHKSLNGTGERRSGLTRDRRSKSVAFHATKAPNNNAGSTPNNNSSSTPNSRRGKDSDGDAGSVGHSPLAWIHRFESWKSQKERKKAEKKRLRHNQRSESNLHGAINEQADTSVEWLRSAIDSTIPLCSQPQKSDIESLTLRLRRRSSECQRPSTETIAILEEPLLSRSFSDPFRSPVGIAGQHQRQITIEKARRDAEHGSSLLQTLTGDVNKVSPKPDIDEVRKTARSGSGRPSRGFSDQSTLSRSTNSYVNTASFTLEPQDEGHDETSSDHALDKKSVMQGQVMMLEQEQQPSPHELLYSPIHSRSSSMDFAVGAAGGCAPPRVRRLVSVSAVIGESNAQQKRVGTFKRIDDCSQAIRDRANVLQYMHRKVSDASSLSGSIPQSPARMSESSSDSSRFGDHTSNQSDRSMRFRTSSFSFFEKLSIDLENCSHGLDNLVDDGEFETEGIDRRSSMSSSLVIGRSKTVDEKQGPMDGSISISSYN
ncbi:unnamed protein product [Peronospora belbahrii]|uniref:Rab-GAP TBC domain-containing protein n=1 Tax=Peronospora belbahrii TaxID=622444 RepID=A0AAU9LDN2_9STRA|nr:unnamed protein product [Peronospora belbahrii]CAH0522283.1 unnamed protein product [Peronospora belbahrii]